MTILKPNDLGPVGRELQEAASNLLVAFSRQWPGLAEAAFKGAEIQITLSNGAQVKLPRMGFGAPPKKMPGLPGIGGGLVKP